MISEKLCFITFSELLLLLQTCLVFESLSRPERFIQRYIKFRFESLVRLDTFLTKWIFRKYSVPKKSLQTSFQDPQVSKGLTHLIVLLAPPT